jgi:hypothetical protein
LIDLLQTFKKEVHMFMKPDDATSEEIDPSAAAVLPPSPPFSPSLLKITVSWLL